MSTKIEWAQESWSPIRGCSPVSEACRFCWAARMANRHRGGAYKGFVEDGKWAGRVELIPDQLDKPLHWRKPRRVAVALMGDLFHEALADSSIGRVFGTMAQAHWHTFLVLTKRALRLKNWSEAVMHYPQGDRAKKPVPGWPPNVHLGVSVEDQGTADERIPLLLQTPAAVRWVSYEPALGPVDFKDFLYWFDPRRENDERTRGYRTAALSWLVIGGESGPGARPCNVEWIRSAVRQCREAGVPVFVKQLGRWVVGNLSEFRPNRYRIPGGSFTPAFLGSLAGKPPPEWTAFSLWHPKGGDPAEWPSDLRVREFPG